MSTLAVIGLIVVIVVAGIAIYAATRPATFRVQRTAGMKAPPEKIFPLIDDLQAWVAWSPYEKKDPTMRKAFGPDTVGKGARYGWDGDRNVGRGSIEILESTPPQKIVLKLDFVKPFEAHNMGEFTLVPRGGATDVTWAIHGPNTFMSKAMGLFINIDKMVGQDFEQGLANLKAIVEK